jgi:hypothetical protein
MQIVYSLRHMKSAFLAFGKNLIKSAILENGTNYLLNEVVKIDFHAKACCIWPTNEGIRVFSYHH